MRSQLFLAGAPSTRLPKPTRRAYAGKPSPGHRLVRTEKAGRLYENLVEKATLSLLFDITDEGRPSTPPFKVRQAAEAFPASAT